MHTSSARLVAVLACWLIAAEARAEWVTFGAPVAETGDPVSPVRGLINVPAATGPHPGVVLMPSCAGRKPYHDAWLQSLAERGFVALVVDDFFMHDHGRTCALSVPAARADALRLRTLHALGALRYLDARPEVDGSRLALMGWGDAPLQDAVVAAGDADRGAPKAVVAVTPSDCDIMTRPALLPTLVLRGGQGELCVESAHSAALEVRTYAGTVPGFDDPRAGALAGRTTREQPGARRYDRLAHVRAIEDVGTFLGEQLRTWAGSAGTDYAPATVPAAPAGTWAVDPHAPGPDLPPAGNSLFDAVFSRTTPDGVEHDVPFPFERLLERLEQAAGVDAMARSPLDATLIPLGRSLQREAAAPDYFGSPRIVVGVTGEPAAGSGMRGLRLKGRLFLGYQPRARVLEIISYNAEANRYEFQLVRDYGAGGKPEVRYARRALCTSCHQNGGPIFADASWNETSANARIADRLGGLGPRFHGVSVDVSDRAAGAIDSAADEAGLLMVYQRLWLEGCAASDPAQVRRCRAGALQAMVQYRLSGYAGFDRGAALYASDYVPTQVRNWAERWPDGLLIPDSNLPDRSPLMSPSPSVVPAALDPLAPRAPRARWQSDSARDLERLVRGLSHLLPERDIAALDRHLRETGLTAPGQTWRARCGIVRRGVRGRPRLLDVNCTPAPGGAGFRLEAQVRAAPDGRVQGEASWLEVDGGAYARVGLVGRVEEGEGERLVLRVVRRDGATSIRGPDGHAISTLVVDWDADVIGARFDASATMQAARDFTPVAAALRRHLDDPPADSPLGRARFDGLRLAGWLLSELGEGAGTACCARRPLPEPQLDFDASATRAALTLALEHRGPLLTFERYCGACHGGDTVSPPGFLHGEPAQVLDQVSQCAERIFYRLSMWAHGADERAVPPMPPAQGLAVAGTTVDVWRAGEPLERLTRYVSGLIDANDGDPGSVLDGEYQAARACLDEHARAARAASG